MKKLISIISITMMLVCTFTFSSCSEKDFDEKYKDPSLASDVEIGKLYSGTLLFSREWAMSTYGRFFGWESQVLMKQANTVGFTPEGGVFYHYEGYTDGMPPLGDLAKLISSYHFMEAAYKGLSEAEQAPNTAYLLTAEVQMYAMTAYILSIFGDIPFDDIGQVAVTQNIATAHPHYQDDQALYGRILDRLGALNNEIANLPTPDGLFKTQDFINKGDLAAWRRYTNSIRLRVALLVSTNGPLASKGQTVLAEILNDPSGHPIVESNDQNICMRQVWKEGSELNINGGSGFDWVNQRIASSELIKRMNKDGNGGVWVHGQDDPRLPILFCKATPNGEFPVDEASTDPAFNQVQPPSTAFPRGKAIPTVFRGCGADGDPDVWYTNLMTSANRAYYSWVRENGFFRNNHNWENAIITAAEVNFIKAEAIVRGWATGDAKAAFKAGVVQSIDFYFDAHEKRTGKDTDLTGTGAYQITGRAVITETRADYSDAELDAFAESLWNNKIDGSAYVDKIEAIIEQKWVNFGYEYAGEQWNDLRRTGYPRMQYLKDTDANAECPYPINRSRYPESERNNNLNFYDEVGSQDNWYDVLFWAKADWFDKL